MSAPIDIYTMSEVTDQELSNFMAAQDGSSVYNASGHETYGIHIGEVYIHIYGDDFSLENEWEEHWEVEDWEKLKSKLGFRPLSWILIEPGCKELSYADASYALAYSFAEAFISKWPGKVLDAVDNVKTQNELDFWIKLQRDLLPDWRPKNSA